MTKRTLKVGMVGTGGMGQGVHRFEIRHFAECVENDLPVRVKPEESLQVQRIIDAIYKSAQTNREVRLSS